MSETKIIVGDCVSAILEMPESCIDAVVTDPPYELGFMGKAWDASGVAFKATTWAAILRVLKPGGHLLAFGGTRTYHRMTCAIEDAGFEIRDSLHWIYGTGFPKSLNLGDGRGTALKPGHEPIVLARKPLVGTVAQNVQAWGTGALNIDGCRIDAFERLVRPQGQPVNAMGARTLGSGRTEEPGGRWPANVLLDEDAAAELDGQSGTLKAGVAGKRGGKGGEVMRTGFAAYDETWGGYGDSGGASRFFYVAKPSRRERGEGNTHPTVKPVTLMRYLVRLVTPPGGTVLDPFFGSGTTALACQAEGLDCIGIELESAYAEIATERIRRSA